MNTNEWFHPSCLQEYRWRWWWCSPRLYHNSYYWWCSTSAQFDYNEHRNVPSQREKKESNSLFLFGNWEKLNYFIYSCFLAVVFWVPHIFLCIKKSIGEYSIWTEEELLFYSSGSRMRAFWSHTHSVCRFPFAKHVNQKYEMKLFFGHVLQWVALHRIQRNRQFLDHRKNENINKLKHIETHTHHVSLYSKWFVRFFIFWCWFESFTKRLKHQP